MLTRQEFRDRLYAAQTAEEIYGVLHDHETASTAT